MTFCTNCGTQLGENAKFCLNCGQPVGTAAAATYYPPAPPVEPLKYDIEGHNLQIGLQTQRGPAQAVRGISFSLERGETLGIVGESGCGKSTLGKALAGIHALSGGTIAFEGEQISQLSVRERRAVAGALVVGHGTYQAARRHACSSRFDGLRDGGCSRRERFPAARGLLASPRSEWPRTACWLALMSARGCSTGSRSGWECS